MLPSSIEFGREVCGDLAVAESREWLVTNGLGSFAMGTVAGTLTRRYHGLLVAALSPPHRRTLLVSKFDEVVEYNGRADELGANRWGDGTIAPEGFRWIERFRLEGATPVWDFAVADALLEKRVWMEQGANTTYVSYRLLRASGPAALTVKALVNFRGYHGATHAGDWRMAVERTEHGIRVTPYSGATAFSLLSADAEVEPAQEWYRNFELSTERERGLDDREDHLHAATFRVTLNLGESATFVLTTEPRASLDGLAARARRENYEQSLLDRWRQAKPKVAEAAPPWIRQLVLAADQFIVQRVTPHDPDGLSVIAGYPWFGEWGRDAMIALPGLSLVTGRPEVARRLLQTWLQFLDQGMMPNCISETGETPLFNSVDAGLWAIEAVRQYHAATQDADFVRDILPKLFEIVGAYADGARFNIHADPKDGLLDAGEPGVQLTWMDAKIGDWVVTPRIGKAVEVNALWLSALATVMNLFKLDVASQRSFTPLAQRIAALHELARGKFLRFWNPGRGFCFDVLDGPKGNDATLRPNQLLVVALPNGSLPEAQQRAVVDVCARQLLTSYGLRSLDPSDPAYQGRYEGPQSARDAAYHQGTAWGWLLGTFALAHYRVYRDKDAALRLLQPIKDHLQTAGLGTASEIFEGDPPHAPRGCIAQAWTVGEWLRAWHEISSLP